MLIFVTFLFISAGGDGNSAGSEGGDAGSTGGSSNGSENSSGDDGGGPGGSDTGDSGSEATSGSFTERGLKAHNMFRKIHGSPAMKLNQQMSKEAEEYAKKLASMGTLQHAQTDYGENLAMKCSSQKEDEMTAEEATRNWYVFS